jgi:hypothetical protein
MEKELAEVRKRRRLQSPAREEGGRDRERWGEEEGRKDAHLPAGSTYQMVHLIVCVQLSMPRV